MSGAVGSRPSLMRSGTPVASERASFWIHSLSGISSLQRRSDRARASRTELVTGYPDDGGAGERIEADITGCYGTRATGGRYTARGVLQASGIVRCESGRAPPF